MHILVNNQQTLLGTVHNILPEKVHHIPPLHGTTMMMDWSDVIQWLAEGYFT
jgi:hypothetical protein